MLLGKYHVIAELGSGGMAKVYLAVSEGTKNARFEKLVVIKRPKEDFVSEPEIMSMFLDEARIAARLNHPNVVQTLDVGEEEGFQFLAMEYLDGQPLHRVLRRAGSKLPRPMFFAILADALAGLHHAHELKDFDGKPLRVIHRDFTPHNIFVTYDGQVKVLDFGIAKAEGRASQTSIGVVKGKVTYMSPEQVQGAELDRRSDIFAAGLILFEAATRSRFWTGVSDADIVRRLLGGELPKVPSEANVPPAVERMITRALAWDRDERYGSAAELQTDIDAYLSELGARPTAREVGKVVAELFVDRRKALQDVVETQLSELKRLRASSNTSPKILDAKARLPSEPSIVTANESSARPGRRPGFDSLHDHASVPVAPSSVTNTGTVGGTAGPARAAAPMRGAVIIGAFVATAIVASAAILAQSLQRPAVLSPMPRHHEFVEAAPLPSHVKVMLHATPSHTKVRVDEGQARGTPFESSYRRDDREHTIVAEADGYVPQTFTMRFDHDTALGVTLSPEPKPSTPPKK